MVEELKRELNENGNIKVRAYYKIKTGIKYYYDYICNDSNTVLNGSFEVLDIMELIYYIEEQSKLVIIKQ